MTGKGHKGTSEWYKCSISCCGDGYMAHRYIKMYLSQYIRLMNIIEYKYERLTN